MQNRKFAHRFFMCVFLTSLVASNSLGGQIGSKSKKHQPVNPPVDPRSVDPVPVKPAINPVTDASPRTPEPARPIKDLNLEVGDVLRAIRQTKVFSVKIVGFAEDDTPFVVSKDGLTQPLTNVASWAVAKGSENGISIGKSAYNRNHPNNVGFVSGFYSDGTVLIARCLPTELGPVITESCRLNIEDVLPVLERRPSTVDNSDNPFGQVLTVLSDFVALPGSNIQSDNPASECPTEGRI